MVQCHLCQLWVHYECVGEQPETIIGVWNGYSCRQVQRFVKQLVDKVSNLEETMLQLKENNINQTGEGEKQMIQSGIKKPALWSNK